MDYSELLLKVNPVFADQILRSGTSVGSHTREAQGAESLADFIHKMKIAHKELEETDYRLSLCHIKPHYPHSADLIHRTRKLLPLLNRILATSNEAIPPRTRRPKGAPGSVTEPELRPRISMGTCFHEHMGT